MDLQLLGRTVFVTGGSRGIGRAIALGYAGEGARVAFSYHSHRELADQTAAAIRDLGAEALPVRVDLDEPSSGAAAVTAIGRRWGGVDVFVANAVRWPDELPDQSRRFEHVPDTEWQGMLRANVEGLIALLQAVLPAMRGRADARIVLISSDLVRHRDPALHGLGFYSAAKAALVGLANGLISDLAGEVLVNIVSPGLTTTERNLTEMPQPVRDQQIARTATRRLSTPDDIARAVLFLGSPANGNITGELVTVAGGFN
ncbi:SDR family NAD(P)-dependent oxidoreductase [Actinophytocola gossypii]|uniref:SDR family oxidoreductase n=1 Tax=Actinophytocola gossypii TaxID=2812003 RepID=A0ABT2JC14_9PSEU|nr:SDR family oxidoreductase [Actinophytocola gossypii]MCT2585266.1 SDR family oxidoreductase [Actinophytocola gossypii]